MNTSTDFDRIAQDWLQDGPTELPDRALQAALDEVHVTSQQHFGAARRTIHMNGNTPRFAVAAVIGLLILIGGGIYLGNGQSGGVGGQPVTTPSPVPTPTPIPLSGLTGEAGTYIIDGPFAVPGITMTLEDGFAYGNDASATVVNLSIPVGETAPAWLTFNIVDEVYPDPCGAPRVPTPTPLGPTVDDLVGALRNLNGYDTSPVTDVAVGGLPAKSFELTDAATNACLPGTLIFEANGVDTNKDSYQRMVVLDVGGQRLLIRSLVLSPPGDPSTQDYRDTIDRAIGSISFD